MSAEAMEMTFTVLGVRCYLCDSAIRTMVGPLQEAFAMLHSGHRQELGFICQTDQMPDTSVELRFGLDGSMTMARVD